MAFLEILSLNGADSLGMFGWMAAMGVGMIIVSIALYIYMALALMYMARRLKTPNAWLAWIPIANIYLVTQMAGKSGWWTLMVLAPAVPFIGGIAFAAVMVWFLWIVAEKLKFPGWTSLLTIIPVVNLIILGIWAWAKK